MMEFTYYFEVIKRLNNNKQKVLIFSKAFDLS